MKATKRKLIKSKPMVKTGDTGATDARFKSFPTDGRVVYEFSEALASRNVNEVYFPASEWLNALSGEGFARHPLHPHHEIDVHGESVPSVCPSRLGELQRLQRERVIEFEAKIQAHPMMRWLESQVSFHELMKSFARQQKSEKWPLYRRWDSRYALLRILAKNVPAFILTPDDFRPQDPSTREIHITIGHIEKLLEDIWDRNVRREHHLDHIDLDHSLEAFRRELSERVARPNSRSHVKRRDDQLSHFREFNIRVASALKDAFGVASPVLVTHIARLIGSAQDERIILSHIKEI